MAFRTSQMQTNIKKYWENWPLGECNDYTIKLHTEKKLLYLNDQYNNAVITIKHLQDEIEALKSAVRVNLQVIESMREAGVKLTEEKQDDEKDI